ncbi:hypothetical protein AB0M46_13455 [Dactylosporangium sp. NPDC051485]|uniref:hypothetical protein n=1 Tax=Dactylosporangium sp. NPDC051485 TaxID=3154846 RepID=UPI00342D2864
MRLDDLAHRLQEAGDELAAASSTLSIIDPGARALGGDAGTSLGRTARDLHRLLATALADRGAEASAHGARLTGTAHALRQVAAGYRSVEDDARSAP